MSRTDDDDRTVDGLLEAALRTRRASGAPDDAAACPDAESIAAWAEGTLTETEALAVEAHLSSCARCQEIAAVLAHASPAMPAAAPWWRRPHVRWLAPALAGAGALGLLVWTAGPRAIPRSPHEAIVQQKEAIARGEPAAAAEATPPSAAGRAAQTRADEIAPSAASPDPRSQAGTRPAADTQTATAQRELRANAAGNEMRDASRAAATPPPPRPAIEPPPVGAVTVPIVPTQPPPAAPPVAQPFPPQPVQELRRAAPQTGQLADAMVFAKPSVVAEFSVSPGSDGLAPVPQAPRRVGGRGGRRGGAAREEVAAAKPNQPVRWRVMSTGVVEKSTDEGLTWTRAAVDPALQITGGVAPEEDVCWLIGRGGVVLRSTDGVSFRRVAFPEQIDLMSIAAVGDRQATVLTASGRRLTTVDGGQTWR